MCLLHLLLCCLCNFFFSSRRRHTRLVSDWSSDVCSSDLEQKAYWLTRLSGRPGAVSLPTDRERPPVSSFQIGKRRVGKSVDLGGRRIIKKKKKKKITRKTEQQLLQSMATR